MLKKHFFFRPNVFLLLKKIFTDYRNFPVNLDPVKNTTASKVRSSKRRSTPTCTLCPRGCHTYRTVRLVGTATGTNMIHTSPCSPTPRRVIVRTRLKKVLWVGIQNCEISLFKPKLVWQWAYRKGGKGGNLNLTSRA